MVPKTIKTKSPCSETRKAKYCRERWFKVSSTIEKMKKLLVEKGIITKPEISSREDVLFAVVKWITSEDLHQIFPPLVFNEGETRKTKQERRDQRRREKQSAAVARMKTFIFNRGSITRYQKDTIQKLDVFMEVLEFIENQPSDALPVPPMNAKDLQTGPLESTQMVIPPLKHSFESKNLSKVNSAIEKMKELLIKNEIKTQSELSSQEDVLFGVVKWITSEDLQELFPPLVFSGGETYETKRKRRNQQQKDKKNTALMRMEKFVLSEGIITKYQKITIKNLDVLNGVLKFIENKSSDALPVPPKDMQTGLVANTQIIIPPSKHSVESLESSVPINVVPQFDLQSFVFNIPLWNMGLQNQMNQMVVPVENTKNINGEENVFFDTPQQF
ncbi:unnamed protein product [Caenorhabditis brenneri]